MTYTARAPKQIGWLAAWFNDPQLRKDFNNNYAKMKSFANAYGYGSTNKAMMVRHIQDMKRHKTVNQEMKE